MSKHYTYYFNYCKPLQGRNHPHFLWGTRGVTSIKLHCYQQQIPNCLTPVYLLFQLIGYNLSFLKQWDWGILKLSRESLVGLRAVEIMPEITSHTVFKNGEKITFKYFQIYFFNVWGKRRVWSESQAVSVVERASRRLELHCNPDSATLDPALTFFRPHFFISNLDFQGPFKLLKLYLNTYKLLTPTSKKNLFNFLIVKGVKEGGILDNKQGRK